MNKYLMGWLTKAEFLAKYDVFTKRHLDTLVMERHKNGFDVCCKKLGQKVKINENLIAGWLEQHDKYSDIKAA